MRRAVQPVGQKDRATALGQGRKRRIDRSQRLAVQMAVGDIAHRASRRNVDIAAAVEAFGRAPGAPQVIDGQIVGYRVEIGARRTGLVRARPALGQPQPGVMHQILRRLPIAGAPGHKADQRGVAVAEDIGDQGMGHGGRKRAGRSKLF